MSPTLHYFCPCNSHSPVPPSATLPSSAHRFHALSSLFFCEECDAVRCNNCVSTEISSYYCPNCLFEVPSASVRAEKNRCARNCFVCPACANTLAVVPSDPHEGGDVGHNVGSNAPVSTVGEPPFFLYCNHCRWDSAEVGITFEKPTGLATQLQKFEDAAPESLEFERLKEHFEPFLRASATAATNPSTLTPHAAGHHANPITAAAASALNRDVSGVARYTPHRGAGGGVTRRDRTANKDEMPEYRSRLDIGTSSLGGGGGGDVDVEFLRRLESVEEVASVDSRWRGSWAGSLRTSDLRPVRIPLQTKKTKRCGLCKHILIKPEQKAQSVRFKIKLVAANYLPSLSVSLPHQRPPAGVLRAGAAPPAPAAGLQAGRTYPFRIGFTNPLYDPIQVRLSVQRSAPILASGAAGVGGAGEEKRRPPFAVSIPTQAFGVAAFAEAWEYDDDEEMEDAATGMGEDATMDERGGRTVGVLERKANVTVVGGEVVLGKAARGDVKFTLLVTFTYRSDEQVDEDGVGITNPVTPSRGGKAELKTFAFSTAVDLGPVVAKEAEA